MTCMVGLPVARRVAARLFIFLASAQTASKIEDDVPSRCRRSHRRRALPLGAELRSVRPLQQNIPAGIIGGAHEPCCCCCCWQLLALALVRQTKSTVCVGIQRKCGH